MKAMILAAGRGERLRPYTDHTPKPLLRVGGQPLITHLLRALARDGFNEVVVNLAHLGDQIEQTLGDGKAHGVRIQYSRETHGALETAGGIAHALPLLGDAPFLVVNGDLACDYPFARLRHTPPGLAHLVLVPNPPHKDAGDFWLDGLGSHACVSGVGEGYTFSGIGVYRPALFHNLNAEPLRLAPLLRSVMPHRQVTAELHRGYWRDVGTVERLHAVDADYRALSFS